MTSRLAAIITAEDDATRNQSLDEICRAASFDELLAECAALDSFRRESENLYERVRALFFLICDSPLPSAGTHELKSSGLIPHQGYEHLLQRRFEEAIEVFLTAQREEGASDALSSSLSAAYHRLAFQTLADQGAPQRPLRARQSMDVSHGPSEGSAAADSQRAAHAEFRRRVVSRCCGSARRCRMDLTHSGGATFSSSG
jgi:hypothetical protein